MDTEQVKKTLSAYFMPGMTNYLIIRMENGGRIEFLATEMRFFWEYDQEVVAFSNNNSRILFRLDRIFAPSFSTGGKVPHILFIVLDQHKEK